MTERVSVRFSDEQLDKIDDLVEAGVYPNRSEVVRGAIWELLEEGVE